MGGKKKKGGFLGSVSKAVSNVAKTVSKAVSDTKNTASKAVNDAGRAIGKAGSDTGNALSTAGTQIWKEGKKAADIVTPMMTYGLYSTDGKSGLLQGNSLKGAYSAMLGAPSIKKYGGDLLEAVTGSVEAPEAPAMDDMPAPTADAPLDPYLEEELKNARKRSRASTILAGSTANGSSGTARRTLLGS